MESEYQFSNNLVRRVFSGQVQRAGTEALALPQHQPMSDDQEQLLEEVADVISEVGDSIDRNPRYKSIIEKFANVASKESFKKLADKVFDDGITWGKIVTLIWVVGKAMKKMLDHFFGLVSGIVSWTLGYIKDNLLDWICSVGGWIKSLASLTCYAIQ